MNFKATTTLKGKNTLNRNILFNFLNPKFYKSKKAFLFSTFSVMGYIAKLDGMISEDEIKKADMAMAKLNLKGTKRTVAIRNFMLGKNPEYNLEKTLINLIDNCNRNIIKTFLEIQFNAATINNAINSDKIETLEKICQTLGFLPLFPLKNSPDFNKNSQNYHKNPKLNSNHPIDKAYSILGVSKITSLPEIKNQYRKLINKYHPDKLIAQGSSETLIKNSNNKIHEITNAYELIKKYLTSSSLCF
jgi:DnaJ like chaperone protein